MNAIANVDSAPHTTLELIVDNHAGVMTHVCGLFSRRAFNLEGILCMPLGDGARSRLLLRVRNDGRLEQLMKQLEKLEDVHSARHDENRDVFARLAAFAVQAWREA